MAESRPRRFDGGAVINTRQNFCGLLMELADMPLLESGAVKSVGVRILCGPPSLVLSFNGKDPCLLSGYLGSSPVGSPTFRWRTLLNALT